MNRSSLAVINEFLRAGGESRKNAVTALAALNTDESLRQLVEVATTDADPDVRKQAEREITGLDLSSDGRVVACLQAALNDRKKRQAAYALLGRLRNQGALIPTKRLPFLTSLRLAASVGSYLAPRRDFLFRTRGVKPAVVGGAIGFVVLVMLMLMVLGLTDMGSLSQIFFLCAAFWVSSGLTLSQREPGMTFQYKRWAAVVVELIWAVVGGAAAALIFVGFVGLYQSGWLSMLIPLKLMGKMAILGGVARFGTLVSFGVFNRSQMDRYAQGIVAVACGLVFITAVPLSLGLVGDRYSQINWLVLFPTAFAVAWTLASIDLSPYPRRPLFPKALAIAASATVLGIVLAAAVISVPRSQSQGPSQAALIVPTGDGHGLYSFTSDQPIKIQIRETMHQHLSARIAGTSCRLSLLDFSGARIAFDTFNPRIESDLRPETYVLEGLCLEGGSSGPSSVLPVLVSRAKARLGRGVAGPPRSWTLQLDLTRP